jgi:hypothetical protein
MGLSTAGRRDHLLELEQGIGHRLIAPVEQKLHHGGVLLDVDDGRVHDQVDVD